MFFPRRRVKHKRFTYEPRYYNQTRDENLKNRLRIKRRALSRRRNPSQLLLILALLIMALYIFAKL